jgi:hypothetical protein
MKFVSPVVYAAVMVYVPVAGSANGHEAVVTPDAVVTFTDGHGLPVSVPGEFSA